MAVVQNQPFITTENARLHTASVWHMYCRQCVQPVLYDVDQVWLESQSESGQLVESANQGENRKTRQHFSRGKIANIRYVSTACHMIIDNHVPAMAVERGKGTGALSLHLGHFVQAAFLTQHRRDSRGIANWLQEFKTVVFK